MLDVETGAHVRSLVGHGQGINELAISPLSTNILASASEDYTIRLWDLRPKYEHQPCVAMFAGGGHKMPILAMAFHPNGRWLLSAGMDTAVCLWAVPPLDQLERGEVQESNSKTHVDPMMIHYPHFRSTEVHHNYVDCMVFYGDLIISRNANSDPNTAKENEILLWKIDGFDSELEPPAEYPTPVPGVDTRSAFPHASDRRGFQRLLTFDMPYTDRFYLRFSLLHAPGFRPILAMGSVKYRYSLWDLQALEEGYEENGDVLKNAGRKRKGKQKGAINSENLSRLEELRKGDTSSGVGSARQQPSTDGRESSVATGHGSGTRQYLAHSHLPTCADLALADPSTTSISAPTGRKYDVDDSFQPIAAHRFITAKNNLYKQYFATPQMDWSPDGSWLIGVADKGMMVMMKRDKAAGRSEP